MERKPLVELEGVARWAIEVARLKRELEQVKEERDILKKAAAYFAKELG